MKFQPIIGMFDILPQDWRFFQKIEKVAREYANFYGFQRLDTPILERVELFTKATSRGSDLLEKEMITFRTKEGERVVLRPQGTLPTVRAVLEGEIKNSAQPLNLWYFGPFFRYQPPRVSKYRQFHLLGFESLGSADWSVDVKIIKILYNILKDLGFKNLIVTVNSIGDSQCRPYYKKQLNVYFRHYKSSLCAECRRKLKINPLLVLSCPEEKCQRIVRKGVPQVVDYLCQECHDHFKYLLEALEELDVPFTLNPYLVREFDYYTKTVFEIYQEGREESLALASGGRYDNLIKTLGGEDRPGCGGSLMVERVVDLMKEKRQSASHQMKSRAKIFIAQVSPLAKIRALKLIEELRENNFKIYEVFHKDSLSAQLKTAEKMHFRYVLILGQKETLEKKVILRDMESGKQKIISMDKIVRELKKLKI